jgi:hypothetical protein
MTLPSSGISFPPSFWGSEPSVATLALLAEIRSYLESYQLRDDINPLTLPYQSTLAFLVLKADKRYLGRHVPR